MSFTPKSWVNSPSTSTPLDAAALIDLETRVTAYVPLGSPNNPVTTASASRPTGLTVVYWQCTTQPTNWISGDIWINNS